MRRMRDTVGMERGEAGVMVTEETWDGSRDSADTRVYNTRDNSTGLYISGCGLKGTYWSMQE